VALDLVDNGSVSLVCQSLDKKQMTVDLNQLVQELSRIVIPSTHDAWTAPITKTVGFDASIEQYSPVGCSSGPISTADGIVVKTETLGPRSAKFATTCLVVATNKDTGDPHSTLLVTSFYAKGARKSSHDMHGVYAYPAIFYGIVVASAREKSPKEIQNNFDRLAKANVVVKLNGNEDIVQMLRMETTIEMLWTNFVTKAGDIYFEKYVKSWSDTAITRWCENDGPLANIDWASLWEYTASEQEPLCSKRSAIPNTAMLRQQERPAKRVKFDPLPPHEAPPLVPEPEPEPDEAPPVVPEPEPEPMVQDDNDAEDVVKATEVLNECVPTTGDMHSAFVRSNARVIKQNNITFPKAVMHAVGTGDLRQVIEAIHTNQKAFNATAAEFADKFMRVSKTVFNLSPFSARKL